MAQDSGEVEQIKAEIEETRAGMSETIDEIQERLRPANLARQAGESIRDATVARAKDLAERASEVAGEIRERPGDVGVAAMRLVSENPAVAAVIGIFATVMGVRALRSGRKRTGYLMGAAVGMAGWGLWQAYGPKRQPDW
ncbi:MAG TPA: DUF3618 domain-containing protein [Vicinamibacterales bacterium]|jgi:ElaB/YqjD/DUF883 family membrane-anchored ribosome-binding protein|nr:DUF3618 domain-containing protein [Vicinamibacterales bacterium]